MVSKPPCKILFERTKSFGHFQFFPKSLSYTGFCYNFIAISVLVLPLAIITQFLSVHCLYAQSTFLPIFSRIYHVSKIVIYISVELSKRMPLGFTYLVGLARYRYSFIKEAVLVYAYFYTVCMTCYIIYAQWLLGQSYLVVTLRH